MIPIVPTWLVLLWVVRYRDALKGEDDMELKNYDGLDYEPPNKKPKKPYLRLVK